LVTGTPTGNGFTAVSVGVDHSIAIAQPAPVPVGGSVTGVSLKRVVCRNVTTDQELVIELNGATSWDCTAAGLVVNPGDRIRQNLVGRAD